MKRFSALLLAAVILFAAAAPTFAASKFDPAEKATDIKNYYRNHELSPASSEETLIFAATHLFTEKTVPYNTPVENASPAADIAKRICETIAQKQNPSDAEGQNYVALLTERQREDGSFDGRLSDTLYAVIALQAADAEYNRDKAIQYILSLQHADGGFSETEDSADTITLTSMTASVLSIFRHENKTNYDAAEKTILFLAERQNEDGGFSSSGVSNCIETAYAVLAATDMEKLSEENWQNALKALANFQSSDDAYGLVSNVSQSDRQATALALMAFEAARYGASVYKTLATNKTIAPSFSFEYFKPILTVFAVLAGLSVLFWIYIFVRKPKTKTLEESKRETERAIEIAEEYIQQQKQKENKNPNDSDR